MVAHLLRVSATIFAPHSIRASLFRHSILFPSLPSSSRHCCSSISTSHKKQTDKRITCTASMAPPDIPLSGEDVSSQAHILAPIQQEGLHVLLLFFPGAFVAPQDYFPLLQKLQSRCTFRLWIAVLDPGEGNYVSTPMIEASFDGLLNRVKEQGFKHGELAISNVFVGGHSWGAWVSRAVAVKRAEAFIQLGSCFHTNPDNLHQYPKPVLTLSGERDGQITLTAIVNHVGEIFAAKSEMGDTYVYTCKPVIIVPGMNHAQVCHGIPNKERGDLDAEIPLEDARSLVADAISSFLTIHVTAEEKETTRAVAYLTSAVKQTQALFRTFWEAIESQGKDVKKLQVELANLPGFTEGHVGVVQHDFLDNFVYSKPMVDSDAKRVVINTYLASAGKYDLLKNLWVKMKSHEAIAFTFGEGETSPSRELSSMGSYFNSETFNQALALVPESARNKFESHGKKLRFIDDWVVKSTAQDWINSDLIIKAAEDGSGFVDVQSPVVITPVEGISSRFAGMHYFKLLTVARAMHWILMDCFR